MNLFHAAKIGRYFRPSKHFDNFLANTWRHKAGFATTMARPLGICRIDAWFRRRFRHSIGPGSVPLSRSLWTMCQDEPVDEVEVLGVLDIDLVLEEAFVDLDEMPIGIGLDAPYIREGGIGGRLGG